MKNSNDTILSTVTFFYLNNRLELETDGSLLTL